MGGTGGAGGTGGVGAMGGTGGTGGTGGSAGAGGGRPGVFESQKMRVCFKGAYRLRLDLARLLELPPEEVCRELGVFDCINVVHGISLGGVDAYYANIYKPAEGTSISAPLIVERLALSACIRRFELDQDLAPDAAGLFQLAATGGDRLADPDAPAVTEAVQRLFQQLLHRDATADELAGIIGLYRDVESDPDTQSPVRDWSVLSCTALLTSVEYLFY